MKINLCINLNFSSFSIILNPYCHIQQALHHHHTSYCYRCSISLIASVYFFLSDVFSCFGMLLILFDHFFTNMSLGDEKEKKKCWNFLLRAFLWLKCVSSCLFIFICQWNRKKKNEFIPSKINSYNINFYFGNFFTIHSVIYGRFI